MISVSFLGELPLLLGFNDGNVCYIDTTVGGGKCFKNESLNH